MKQINKQKLLEQMVYLVIWLTVISVPVGVWYAMLVDWVCRVICFVARFATGAWKKNAVKKV